MPYKKLRSNVDIQKFVSTHPGVPLNPDYVNMEKPIDQTGRTSGKTPSTMKLRQVIRNWTFIKQTHIRKLDVFAINSDFNISLHFRVMQKLLKKITLF